MTDVKFYTSSDVAAETGIHPSTVQKWLLYGQFPYTELGRTKVMDQATFEQVCAYARQRKNVRTPLSLHHRANASSQVIDDRRKVSEERAKKAARGNPLLERVLRIRESALARMGVAK